MDKLNDEENVSEKPYYPSDKDQSVLRFVYKEYEVMRDVRNQKYREFNDRTLIEFIDDCQKRANSYVPTRAEQGKEEWQANVFTPYTRNKLKVMLASASKQPPEVHISAINKDSQISVKRAKIMGYLVKASYCYENQEKVIFMDGWNALTNGTIIKYDGYLRISGKVKDVTGYDSETGEVTFTEKEVEIEDRPIEVNIPLRNFFPKEAYKGLNEQSAVSWIEYMTKDQFEYEFGKFKNADKVKSASELHSENERQTFYCQEWSSRFEKDLIEVIRYYNTIKDMYVIIANGVVILNAPMLWGKKRKHLPFAVSGYEPFSNTDFFWYNSLVNILMSSQDVANAFICSMIDKTYRSLVPSMLIGINNKDAFDLEDEYVNGDTKIYVDDVNNVKPMPVDGVNQAEFNMLRVVINGIEEASSDSVQGGSAGSGSTAREIVIANERAEQLKGTFFMFLKDLWLQKYRLRIDNLLMNYSRPRVEKVVGEEGDMEIETYRTFTANGVELSTGQMGAMQVRVKPEGSFSRPFELSVEEEKLKLQGQPTEIAEVAPDYLDGWEYELKLETEALYQKSKSMDMAIVDEKIKGVAVMFPEIFQSNKELFFKDYIKGFGESPEKYLENSQMQQMPQMPGAPQGQSQLMSQIAAPSNPMAALGKLS